MSSMEDDELRELRDKILAEAGLSRTRPAERNKAFAQWCERHREDYDQDMDNARTVAELRDALDKLPSGWKVVVAPGLLYCPHANIMALSDPAELPDGTHFVALEL